MNHVAAGQNIDAVTVAGFGEERVDRLLQLLPERLVYEPTSLVEALWRVTDRNFPFHHPRPDGCQDSPQVRLGPDSPEGPGARADDRDRLVPERVRCEGPGDPVESVLQRARNRRVVFGRRKENRVRFADCTAQSRHRHRCGRRTAALPPRPRPCW